MKKIQMNTKLASLLIDRIYEDDLPITIQTGEKLDNEMVDVLVECEDEEQFTKLFNETANSLVI